MPSFCSSYILGFMHITIYARRLELYILIYAVYVMINFVSFIKHPYINFKFEKIGKILVSSLKKWNTWRLHYKFQLLIKLYSIANKKKLKYVTSFLIWYHMFYLFFWKLGSSNINLRRSVMDQIFFA
jgi:hypothetical protein